MLPEKVRWAVVNGHDDGKSISALSKQFGIDKRTVSKWIDRHQLTRQVNRAKGQGRKPAIDSNTAAAAVQLLTGPELLDATAVSTTFFKQRKTAGCRPVHPCTVIRHAKKAANANKAPIGVDRRAPKKRLNAATLKKRLAFCKAHRGTGWGHFMFTDRKRFMFRYPGSTVKKMQWVKKGQRRTATTCDHPMVLNVYVGLTKFGMTKPIAVTGTSRYSSVYHTQKGTPARNITSAEYKHVVADCLLPEGKRIFTAAGISHMWLQQDNDPTHKKAALQAVAEWNNAHPTFTVKLLPNWPPHSPDLNLIENVWAWAQHKVDAQGCKTFDEFKSCVLQTLSHVPATLTNHLFRSMSKRVTQCIQLQGGKLNC